MNGIIGMTELTLARDTSDLNRSQRENLLLVHSLARSESLLLITGIDDILDTFFILI